MIQFRPSEKFDCPATVILITQEQAKQRKLRQITVSIMRRSVEDLIKTKAFSGEAQQIVPLFEKDKVILLVGLGGAEKINGTAIRTAVRQALLSPPLKKISKVELMTQASDDSSILAAIDGVEIGTYVWDKYRAKSDQAIRKTIFLIAPQKKSYYEADIIATGVNFARDLVNDNADFITAEYIEHLVRSLCKRQSRIRLEILGSKTLKAKGLNLHLAVNQGSRKEPRLIIVKYLGGNKHDPFTAIVGKGLTFDSGGLNIKPTGHMETMRCDMAGAAAVTAVLKNSLSLKLKKNIIFVMAMAENAIGSGSYKPGDVFRSYDGTTVEIKNTDAEGRLVLADAIAYLVKNYKPARIIDIATLTGACLVALGYDYSGLISTDDTLANALMLAAQKTDDRVWRLPNYPEISDSIKSKIAEIKNTGWPGAGGTITAAEFLRHFAKNTAWAHLDIAGTAFLENHPRLYFGLGATGAGIRLLTRFLQDN